MRCLHPELLHPAAAPRAPPVGNLLLRSLKAADLACLKPHLEPVALNEGHVIVAQGELITFVCFPESGVTSVADV